MFQKIKRLFKAMESYSNNTSSELAVARTFYRSAPYSVEIYDKLLNSLGYKEIYELQYFSSVDLSPKRINLFFRHDIDTHECLYNIPLLVDVDLKYRISSSCYLRVDEEEYKISNALKITDKYKALGVEFGLHTICYKHDDYLRSFEKETELFENVFGFRPKTFTVHGLGQYRIDIRNRFSSDISNRLHEFGYDFSDCCANMRTYHYVIEDCHWSANDQCRFIYDDFLKVPETIKPGMNVLTLTHPCYWIS